MPLVGLQYICYTVAYPEQEGEKGKVAGNQTENLPLGGGAELQKKVVSFARFSLLFNCAKNKRSATHHGKYNTGSQIQASGNRIFLQARCYPCRHALQAYTAMDLFLAQAIRREYTFFGRTVAQTARSSEYAHGGGAEADR